MALWNGIKRFAQWPLLDIIMKIGMLYLDREKRRTLNFFYCRLNLWCNNYSMYVCVHNISQANEQLYTNAIHIYVS